MIVKLYNGSVEISFDDKYHTYKVDGERVEGVTTPLSVISKPALLFWAVNQAISYLETELKPGVSYDEIQIKNLLNTAKSAHRRKKEGAADMGTLLHEVIEKWILADIQREKYYASK